MSRYDFMYNCSFRYFACFSAVEYVDRDDLVVVVDGALDGGR